MFIVMNENIAKLRNDSTSKAFREKLIVDLALDFDETGQYKLF